MMKTFKLLFLLLLLGFVAISCDRPPSSTSPTAKYLNGDWAKNSLWDDGNAEVALYDAERMVYGKTRRFEYAYVLVKETFNQEYQVKTDDYERNDLYDVMKVNKFCRIETQKYPYHYLTSVFFRRDNPGQVHKLTNTSQEWCGNTAKSFTENGKGYLFQYMSYWDGQGNGEAKVDKGPWFEDQLSYTLRTLKYEEGLEIEITLYPMQVSSKAEAPQAQKAIITMEKADTTALSGIDPALISSPWKVTVSREAGPTLTYWLNGDYPNVLLKMQSTDGRKLTLKSLKRDAYWAYE